MRPDELIAKTVYPSTPKHQYISIRHYPTETERQLAVQKSMRQWAHIRPNSTLLCPMANHWAPGSWNKVVDMMKHTMEQGGIYVAMQEVQDRCFNPYDALGTMRNEAIMEAECEGFEWLCYVDNDVQPQPDTLLRLLAYDLPVMAPLVIEPGTGKQLSGPPLQPNSGVHPAKWSVLSMLLFRVAVFRPFHGMFWSDAIGADEGIHFQRLFAETGHRLYIDTNTQLVVAGEPLYPLAINRFSWEERQKTIQDKIVKFLAPPDRRAINPFGPNVIDGDYMPFAVGAQPAGGTAQLAAGAPQKSYARGEEPKIIEGEIVKKGEKTYARGS